VTVRTLFRKRRSVGRLPACSACGRSDGCPTWLTPVGSFSPFVTSPDPVPKSLIGAPCQHRGGAEGIHGILEHRVGAHTQERRIERPTWPESSTGHRMPAGVAR